MVTGFSSSIFETHGGPKAKNSRCGFDTQLTFFKDKSTSGCHFDLALMHKYQSIGETPLRIL